MVPSLQCRKPEKNPERDHPHLKEREKKKIRRKEIRTLSADAPRCGREGVRRAPALATSTGPWWPFTPRCQHELQTAPKFKGVSLSALLAFHNSVILLTPPPPPPPPPVFLCQRKDASLGMATFNLMKHRKLSGERLIGH